jgi:hypothetical protein
MQQSSYVSFSDDVDIAPEGYSWGKFTLIKSNFGTFDL